MNPEEESCPHFELDSQVCMECGELIDIAYEDESERNEER